MSLRQNACSSKRSRKHAAKPRLLSPDLLKSTHKAVIQPRADRKQRAPTCWVNYDLWQYSPSSSSLAEVFFIEVLPVFAAVDRVDGRERNPYFFSDLKSSFPHFF